MKTKKAQPVDKGAPPPIFERSVLSMRRNGIPLTAEVNRTVEQLWAHRDSRVEHWGPGVNRATVNVRWTQHGKEYGYSREYACTPAQAGITTPQRSNTNMNNDPANMASAVANVTPPAPAKVHPTHARLLRQFNYQHLPEHLQAFSAPFHDLAHGLVAMPNMDGADVTVGLRKLLEAKDVFVRAALP